MADPFVPLCQRHNAHGSPAPEPHRVKVLTSSNANPAFEPLTSQSSAEAQSIEQPAPEPGPASADPSPHSPHSNPAPVLTVHREEETGRVTGARIQCGCGQVLELKFDYPASASSGGNEIESSLG